MPLPSRPVGVGLPKDDHADEDHHGSESLPQPRDRKTHRDPLSDQDTCRDNGREGEGKRPADRSGVVCDKLNRDLGKPKRLKF